MLDRAGYKQAVEQVNQILWEVWDPIGVNNEPFAFGEYDSYSPGIIQLLLQGSSEQHIYEHLAEIESNRMGIEGHEDNRRRAAQLLLSVKIEGSAA